MSTPPIDRLHVDATSAIAPYEQIRTQLAALVHDGTLTAGTKLPTVRQLAADVGVAANTVGRAYKELEADGVISTDGRRGSFVRSAGLSGAEKGAGTRQAAHDYAATARRAGLTLPEALRLVELGWTRPTSEGGDRT